MPSRSRFLLPLAILFGLICSATVRAETDSIVESGTVLAGPWERPDGGYVIMVNSIDSRGTLEAEYFNPRSIRVASARWRFGAGTLQVRIDLNDRGYEGALYLLRYDPETDRLVGTYQPAGQDSFEVFFIRKKE